MWLGPTSMAVITSPGLCYRLDVWSPDADYTSDTLALLSVALGASLEEDCLPIRGCGLLLRARRRIHARVFGGGGLCIRGRR